LLGSWVPAYLFIKSILNVLPANIDDPTTPIELPIVVSLVILTTPWAGEKIIRTKMSPILGFFMLG
jgi:hypothetical protein